MRGGSAELKHLTVLLCNKYFAPVGGPETVIFETIRMLERGGHTAVPFAMRHPDNLASAYAEYFVPGVDYAEADDAGLLDRLRMARNIIYSPEAARKVRELVRVARPDVAHLHNIYHQISPSVCAALRRERVPMVMTLHDLKLLCASYLFLRDGEICEACGGGRFYNAVRYKCVKGSRAKSLVCCLEMYVHKLLGLYERSIDLFIAPSEFLRSKFLEYGRLPAERIVHISNPIDTEVYVPSYSNDGYCVFVGRVSEYKGIMTLMKAMRANRTVQLRVVGDGDARQSVEDFKRSHSLDNVSLEGVKSEEALRDIIRGASFLIAPSECYENCPMVVLEAFASGKPVVGSRLGGIPEIIEDGVDGLLFEAGNAEDLAEKIRWLAGQEDLLVDMGKAARRKAEIQYSPDGHFKKLLGVYESVMEQHGQKA